jgi:hypothetical protein
MNMLKNFAAWITFLIVTGVGDWRLGLAAGLVVQIVVIATSRPVRIEVLNGAMLAFFAVALALAIARPQSGIEEYIGAISTAWLGLVSLVSLLVGQPFTLAIARAEVSPEVAQTRGFITTNQIITAVWTAYFALTAAISAVAVTNDIPGDRAVQILLLIGAFKFTVDYPKRVRARMQQRPAGASAPASAS